METKISFFDYPIHDPDKVGFNLFGERQEVREANEPSNIAWEFMAVSTSWRNFKKVVAIFITFICLGLIMFGIIALKY